MKTYTTSICLSVLTPEMGAFILKPDLGVDKKKADLGVDKKGGPPRGQGTLNTSGFINYLMQVIMMSNIHYFS